MKPSLGLARGILRMCLREEKVGCRDGEGERRQIAEGIWCSLELRHFKVLRKLDAFRCSVNLCLDHSLLTFKATIGLVSSLSWSHLPLV